MNKVSKRVASSLALAGLGLGCLGCPSMPMLTTAKTIGDANNELTISPGVLGFNSSLTGADGETYASGTAYLPDLALSYRRGIGDSFDLGVTLSGFGKLSLDGKINFLGNEKGDSFALAIDPTIGGFFVGAGSVGAGYIDFGLPLLMDIAFTESVRLTLGPRYRGTYFLATAAGTGAIDFAHFAGSGIGFEFVVSDTVALQPYSTVDLLLNPPGGESIGASGMLLSGGFAIKLDLD